MQLERDERRSVKTCRGDPLLATATHTRPCEVAQFCTAFSIRTNDFSGNQPFLEEGVHPRHLLTNDGLESNTRKAYRIADIRRPRNIRSIGDRSALVNSRTALVLHVPGCGVTCLTTDVGVLWYLHRDCLAVKMPTLRGYHEMSSLIL